MVVDDHAVFCEALSSVLGLEPDIQVVGTGRSMREAIEGVRRLQPDVLLLDVHLPDGSGVDAIAPIKAERPATQIVVLTGDEEEGLLGAAIQAGVTGYLSKHDATAQVLQAVRSAARGEALIAPNLLVRLLRTLRRPEMPARSTPLTPKELQVLSRLALGQDNEAVARSLTMSPNTVRTHVQNILAKLSVHSKLEAVSLALREGWVRLPHEPAA